MNVNALHYSFWVCCLHDIEMFKNSLIQSDMTANCSSLFKLSLNAVMFCLNNHQNQHLIWVLSDLTSLTAVLVLTAVCSFDRLLFHYLKAEFVLNSSVVKSLLNLKSEGILSAVNWHLQLCDDWHSNVTVRITARVTVRTIARAIARAIAKAITRVRTTATVRATARVRITATAKATARIKTTATARTTARVRMTATVRATTRCQCLKNRVSRCSE